MAEDTLPPLPQSLIDLLDAAGIRGMLLQHVKDRFNTHRDEYAAARVAQAVAQERERCAAICGHQSDRARTSTGASRADNCARRIRADSPSPQPAPAGWRLVPEEVTAEMLEASGLMPELNSGSLRGAWRDMLTAAPQPPSAWRPIEEAPRDGTDVLLYCSHGMYVACYWEGTIEWWHVNDNKHGPFPLRGPAPTHWQPLPPPPSAGEEPL